MNHRKYFFVGGLYIVFILVILVFLFLKIGGATIQSINDMQIGAIFWSWTIFIAIPGVGVMLSRASIIAELETLEGDMDDLYEQIENPSYMNDLKESKRLIGNAIDVIEGKEEENA